MIPARATLDDIEGFAVVFVVTPALVAFGLGFATALAFAWGVA
jgi:hypothetical protein